MSRVDNRWRLWLVLGVLLLLTIPAVTAAAQDLDQQSQQCLQCHGNEKFTTEHNGEKLSLYVDVGQFQSSVHGNNSCVTCHSEEIQLPHQAVAYGKELEKKVSNNCVLCHSDPGGKYLNSAHKDNGPTCAECHGSGHQVAKIAGSEQFSKQSVVETCSECHQGKVLDSYEDSFHGKAVNLGSNKAASCIDCHGAHEASGPENPLSPVAAANVAETCASCHKKAASGFAQGVEHFGLIPGGGAKPMYYTYKFFTWLTIVTISLLIIHIELELFRKLRSSKG